MSTIEGRREARRPHSDGDLRRSVVTSGGELKGFAMNYIGNDELKPSSGATPISFQWAREWIASQTFYLLARIILFVDSSHFIDSNYFIY